MKSMRVGWLTLFLVLAVVALVAVVGPGTEAQVGGTFQWTRDGVPLTEPMPIPDGANDIRLVWGPDGTFTEAEWTRDGANDIRLVWGPDGTFTEAEWTRDGEPFLPIPMPDAADMERPLSSPQCWGAVGVGVPW